MPFGTLVRVITSIPILAYPIYMSVTWQDQIAQQLAVIEWALSELAAGSDTEDYVRIVQRRVSVVLDLAHSERKLELARRRRRAASASQS